MNKKHLFWIIPLVLLIGFIAGTIRTSNLWTEFLVDYPSAYCMQKMDYMLNPEDNAIFDADSMREAIQWRCAMEYIDINSSYESVLVIP